MKKIALKPKPQATTPDDWVSAGASDREDAPEMNPVAGARPAAKVGSAGAPAVRFKRLTIDIPAELHTRIKMQCAARGRKMADEIRGLLEESFQVE